MQSYSSCPPFTLPACVQKRAGHPWGIRDPSPHISVSWAHHIQLINPEDKELWKQDWVHIWVRERKGFVGRVRAAERKSIRKVTLSAPGLDSFWHLYEFRIVVEVVCWKESRKRTGSLKGTLEDLLQWNGGVMSRGIKTPWILRRHPLKFPRNAQILLQYGHGPGSSLIPGWRWTLEI